MVKRDVMELVLDEMARGKRDSFRECYLIMEVLSFSKKIPDSFWHDEDKAEFGIMDIYEPLTKKKLRQIRNELIDAIFQRMEIRDLNIKQYVRYFHGLAILDVTKENAEVPAIDNANTQYKIAYELWRLDDGSEENWKHIESIAWYVTEKLKP